MNTSCLRRALAPALAVLLLASPVVAQEAPAPMSVAPVPETSPAASFDTGYRPSPTVASRVQREFLDQLRWSAGIAARDSLAAAFAERSPVEIWQELVAEQGLSPNNVADALTAYWVLNWITANGAYAAQIDNAPVQRQLRAAFAADSNFRGMGDLQRQQLAENYILNFLLEHAALNQAVAARDVDALNRLAAASVARFQTNMGVNLLAVVPSAEGFAPRARR
ncbi:DUF6683 family protein [Devosia chinhatensis]|uniref:Uncharacterized protein n=1 Tax=Devosia chinhatensis TaxID=429727 RepID=A0A0F5FKK1_9HYPH|nr:DUF6683 family protein [Devosia chinhatensis]KKB09070.1 hypothetical protein VE26_03340 [Devosia chinhatensis]